LTSKVAVQKSLKHIIEGLRGLGYDVEQFDRQYRGDAQTIIYSAYSDNTTQSSNLECVTNNLFTNQSYGAFIVNGDGKDANQIDYVIKNRVYSPLF
jgi:hypothetical protein